MVALAPRAFCASMLLVLSATAAGASETVPSAFSSVPVVVSHTPFDREWRRVSAPDDVTTGISSEASQYAGLDRMRVVNARVNRAVTYREDRDIWGADDYWATPSQTLSKGVGDCEDLAILKFHLLQKAGVPASRMFLVIGNDLAARRAHAVLIVREGEQSWVLDNSTDAIRASDDYADFRPIMSFGTGGQWVHGYDAATAPPYQFAEARSGSWGIVPAAMGQSLASVIAAQQGR